MASQGECRARKCSLPLPFKVPVPSVAVRPLNVTVPVGVPAPGLTALTVAVNVNCLPDARRIKVGGDRGHRRSLTDGWVILSWLAWKKIVGMYAARIW